ncbi:g3488 [Coccomyxa viridis]|uniref:G3488 protein n=1 Tax=Coccomyxa viridis TaxID=1274662 RepID=A0ABP1FQU3_9CHLO
MQEAGACAPNSMQTLVAGTAKASGISSLHISSAMASFTVGVKLDPRDVARRSLNVEYNPKKASSTSVMKQTRNPNTTARIYASGKVGLMGAKSEAAARIAARKICKTLTKLGYKARFQNFKINNMMASTNMGFPIHLQGLAESHADCADYDPDMHSDLRYRMKDPKVTLRIFVSGSVTLTGARSREDVHRAFEKISPVLEQFRKGPAATCQQQSPAQTLAACPNLSAPLGTPAAQLQLSGAQEGLQTQQCWSAAEEFFPASYLAMLLD